MTENELIETVSLENFPKICKALSLKIFNESKELKSQVLFDENVSKYEQVLMLELANSMFVTIPKHELSNTASKVETYLIDCFKKLQEMRDKRLSSLNKEIEVTTKEPLN